SFPDAAAVIFDVNAYNSGTGRKRLRACDLVSLMREEVVLVDRLRILDVQRVSPGGAALRHEHAISAALWDLDGSRDGVRYVLGVRGRGLGDSVRAGV